MSEVEQQSTCTICFEPIKEAKEVKPDCCSHTYCFGCIKKWVTDVENTCPQCKRSITQLTYKGPDGQEATLPVERRRQEEIITDCLACHIPVYEPDLERALEDEHRATVCRICYTHVIHVRCLNEEDSRVWTRTLEWLCP